MTKQKEAFYFARQTPAQYLDDLQQLRFDTELDELRALDRVEVKQFCERK